MAMRDSSSLRRAPTPTVLEGDKGRGTKQTTWGKQCQIPRAVEGGQERVTGTQNLLIAQEWLGPARESIKLRGEPGKWGHVGSVGDLRHFGSRWRAGRHRSSRTSVPHPRLPVFLKGSILTATPVSIYPPSEVTKFPRPTPPPAQFSVKRRCVREGLDWPIPSGSSQSEACCQGGASLDGAESTMPALLLSEESRFASVVRGFKS
jgi:hypothetical protein